ncbi:hypothetical protein PPERSA_10154 [Pseudocohnilembus persalinus]|uniref:Uncharacterized protein n=1 Tax=Pseudocohnilembus persalinus TaxID=266149 RepID=A0A0V0QLY3_PSEPJ|nr:hypothetical protein PPERSA_10154 [Pseudocohnilembus persalinus]|eukprot:KRX03073.1 hypothetical protein PPERSA_10154 [Pseudocohnilembus persalinus]
MTNNLNKPSIQPQIDFIQNPNEQIDQQNKAENQMTKNPLIGLNQNQNQNQTHTYYLKTKENQQPNTNIQNKQQYNYQVKGKLNNINENNNLNNKHQLQNSKDNIKLQNKSFDNQSINQKINKQYKYSLDKSNQNLNSENQISNSNLNTNKNKNQYPSTNFESAASSYQIVSARVPQSNSIKECSQQSLQNQNKKLQQVNKEYDLQKQNINQNKQITNNNLTNTVKKVDKLSFNSHQEQQKPVLKYQYSQNSVKSQIINNNKSNDNSQIQQKIINLEVLSPTISQLDKSTKSVTQNNQIKQFDFNQSQQKSPQKSVNIKFQNSTNKNQNNLINNQTTSKQRLSQQQFNQKIGKQQQQNSISRSITPLRANKNAIYIKNKNQKPLPQNKNSTDNSNQKIQTNNLNSNKKNSEKKLKNSQKSQKNEQIQNNILISQEQIKKFDSENYNQIYNIDEINGPFDQRPECKISMYQVIKKDDIIETLKTEVSSNRSSFINQNYHKFENLDQQKLSPINQNIIDNQGEQEYQQQDKIDEPNQENEEAINDYKYFYQNLGKARNQNEMNFKKKFNLEEQLANDDDYNNIYFSDYANKLQQQENKEKKLKNNEETKKELIQNKQSKNKELNTQQNIELLQTKQIKKSKEILPQNKNIQINKNPGTISLHQFKKKIDPEKILYTSNTNQTQDISQNHDDLSTSNRIYTLNNNNSSTRIPRLKINQKQTYENYKQNKQLEIEQQQQQLQKKREQQKKNLTPKFTRQDAQSSRSKSSNINIINNKQQNTSKTPQSIQKNTDQKQKIIHEKNIENQQQILQQKKAYNNNSESNILKNKFVKQAQINLEDLSYTEKNKQEQQLSQRKNHRNRDYSNKQAKKHSQSLSSSKKSNVKQVFTQNLNQNNKFVSEQKYDISYLNNKRSTTPNIRNTTKKQNVSERSSENNITQKQLLNSSHIKDKSNKNNINQNQVKQQYQGQNSQIKSNGQTQKVIFFKKIFKIIKVYIFIYLFFIQKNITYQNEIQQNENSPRYNVNEELEEIQNEDNNNEQYQQKNLNFQKKKPQTSEIINRIKEYQESQNQFQGDEEQSYTSEYLRINKNKLKNKVNFINKNKEKLTQKQPKSEEKQQIQVSNHKYNKNYENNQNQQQLELENQYIDKDSIIQDSFIQKQKFQHYHKEQDNNNKNTNQQSNFPNIIEKNKKQAQNHSHSLNKLVNQSAHIQINSQQLNQRAKSSVNKNIQQNSLINKSVNYLSNYQQKQIKNIDSNNLNQSGYQIVPSAGSNFSYKPKFFLPLDQRDIELSMNISVNMENQSNMQNNQEIGDKNQKRKISKNINSNSKDFAVNKNKRNQSGNKNQKPQQSLQGQMILDDLFGNQLHEINNQNNEKSKEKNQQQKQQQQLQIEKQYQSANIESQTRQNRKGNTSKDNDNINYILNKKLSISKNQKSQENIFSSHQDMESDQNINKDNVNSNLLDINSSNPNNQNINGSGNKIKNQNTSQFQYQKHSLDPNNFAHSSLLFYTTLDHQQQQQILQNQLQKEENSSNNQHPLILKNNSNNNILNLESKTNLIYNNSNQTLNLLNSTNFNEILKNDKQDINNNQKQQIPTYNQYSSRMNNSGGNTLYDDQINKILKQNKNQVKINSLFESTVNSQQSFLEIEEKLLKENENQNSNHSSVLKINNVQNQHQSQNNLITDTKANLRKSQPQNSRKFQNPYSENSNIAYKQQNSSSSNNSNNNNINNNNQNFVSTYAKLRSSQQSGNSYNSSQKNAGTVYHLPLLVHKDNFIKNEQVQAFLHGLKMLEDLKGKYQKSKRQHRIFIGINHEKEKLETSEFFSEIIKNVYDNYCTIQTIIQSTFDVEVVFLSSNRNPWGDFWQRDIFLDQFENKSLAMDLNLIKTLDLKKDINEMLKQMYMFLYDNSDKMEAVFVKDFILDSENGKFKKCQLGQGVMNFTYLTDIFKLKTFEGYVIFEQKNTKDQFIDQVEVFEKVLEDQGFSKIEIETYEKNKLKKKNDGNIGALLNY